MVIPKEDALFKARPPCTNVNVHLCWISLFLKSRWIKTTVSRLYYEVGVNGEKKSMKIRIFLIKIDIAHFTLVNLETLTVKER